ncbi:nickel pincer cofactor biosynthesis protein LarC [Christensenellaceae bacterium 44-20]
MKTLYLQCNMGAAGDMLMAALYELLEPGARQEFLRDMNALGIPGLKVAATPAQKCGIWGTHMDVRIGGQEEHSHDLPHGHCHSHDGEEHGHGCCGHGHTHQGQAGHCHSRAMLADGQNLQLTAPTEPEGHSHHHSEGQGEHSHCHGGHAHSHEEGCCHEHDGGHGEGHGHHHGGEHGHTHEHGHSHSHSGMADIEHLLAHLPVSEQVRENALAVYRLIAQAESHAHGQPVSQIHFHEVGTMDAVADVVGVCMLMERIGAQKILASAVHVGSGQVRCAHGVLPVPAPATAHILRGVPTYGGEIAGELCTPTGAALLRHFAQGFGPMPALCASAIGYGMGTKDFAAANCVRAFLGDDGAGEGGPNGEIALLCCNLDDMPGEDLGFAQQALLDEGALDVYTLPIGMKKNRPAVLLCCICEPDAADKLAAAMLRHTSTFGVRRTLCQRYMLSRSFEQVQTPCGAVRIKTGQGYGVKKSKAEYEDIARIAREQGISLAEARALLK